MPLRLLSSCVPVSQWEQRLFGTLRPRQGKKKLHILTHTAHAANQVGVELVLIVVTGPHVASVCWPCLEGRCPKEPPARGLCTPCSSLKKAAKWTETASQRAVQWTERQQKFGEVAPPTTSYWPPPSPWGQRGSSSLGHFQTGSRSSCKRHPIQKRHQLSVCRPTAAGEVGTSGGKKSNGISKWSKPG